MNIDDETSGWPEVDRLISEQKFEAAVRVVGELRTAARRDGNEGEWTRTLVREVQLRTALHGYEAAVRFLREEPWPAGPRHRAVLELYYAQTLMSYFHAYAWEINQRERVETGTEVDLKSWTRDQISSAAHRSYQAVWAEREAWGGEPIGTLAEYFDQNDYPPRIRGTMRDTVTYLWVELLANTALWLPEQSNELFRLDAERLIAGDPVASAAVDLADSTVHPLVRIGAILDDLESWHRRGDRPEAAFEARLERLRRLRTSFSDDQDRQAIRRNLEVNLDGLGRRYEWWSMGMAALAEFVRDADAPDSLIEARRIAIEGKRAHPESIGGQRCRHLVAAIERPSYQLAAMASDGASRRSIRITHGNLPVLHFRAYALDLIAAVEGAEDFHLLPSYREVPPIIAGRRPQAEWTVELEATPDYRTHHTYVTPPLERPGLYLVVASARRDFAEAFNQQVAMNFILTDLVLLRRSDEGATEVTVRSGDSGKPASGVTVGLYRYDWRSGHRKVAERITGEEGVVRFESDKTTRERYFLVARRGDEVALDQSYFVPPPRVEAEEHTATLVYTDRSVYRPQQRIFWKVVAYRGGGDDRRFATLPEASLTVDLRDPNHEAVATAEVRTNRFGSAAGVFEIPSGRLLGRWQVRTTLGGGADIRVEEYKRPTFEVTIGDPEAPLRLNRPATLGGEVRYYFGLPVIVGTVDWQVTREPIFPPWWWWFGRPTAPPQIIAAGRAELDAEGKFRITFTPAADERKAAKEITYRYRLSADVTDEGGETRSASRSFRLGFVAVEATIRSDAKFLRRGQPAQLTIRRCDLDGVARAGRGEWRVVALAQPPAALLPADQPLPRRPDAEADAFRTPGDDLRPRWDPGYSPEEVLRGWEDGAQLAAGTTDHDENGEAKLRLPDLPAGAYRLRYATRDDFGATFETSKDLLVVGDEPTKKPLALPGILLAEQASVPVGGTARLLVHSGLPDQDMVLEIFGGGRRVKRRLLSSRRGPQLIEIAVGEEHRGGFGVTLTCLRDHQLIHLNDRVFVPWDDRRLKIEFITFRDRLRPGTKESWQLKVTGADEGVLGPGMAELLAYMYDRSLDLFAPHEPVDPITLYPELTATPGVGTSLGMAREAWRLARNFASLPDYPPLRPDRLKFYEGYGIGGPGRGRRVARELMMERLEVAEASAMPAAPMVADAEAESLVGGLAETQASAKAAAPPPGELPPDEPAEPLRSDFAETAFWMPQLRIAQDGAVTLDFSVPDSVTEWNVWVHALTRDLRSGSLRRQAQSVKELMVRPYLPRFLREGDRAELTVVVNNASVDQLRGTLDFDILDAETEESLLAEFGLTAAGASGVAFAVAAGGGTHLRFPVRVPNRVGTVAFRVMAQANGHSDGELRPLPVLPGRVHLAQSRFAALKDRDRRTLHFADLAADEDATRIHEQLVVTLDAQLFYSVLNALPYLVSFPYECTEQHLNRFVSTGILAGLYDDYPAVARMAKQLSERTTPLESFPADDPNRKMALEETPWLVASRGGKAPEDDAELINVLDPKIAAAHRDAALAQLRKTQTSLGGFPWWPGGPPSPYMTLYILYGFSKGLEFGVEVPQDMVVKAWSYMHRHYLDELTRQMMKKDCCWEIVTFLNYVLSNYPDSSWTGRVFTDDERDKMLEFSFGHWRRHSPLLKGYLALTLRRAGRTDDARLVFASVMDSAKTTPDQGTFWAPEDRAWLWYNDTIETHAFALRTLSELEPSDARRHGLVQWLFLNKKLNHWKSTRATAEVIYSLVHYLEQVGALGTREEATVAVGPRTRSFVFDPDRYTGRNNQMVISGDEIDPATMATLEVTKQSPGFLFASATWHFSTEEVPAEARGDFFSVTRRYFQRVATGREWVLRPLGEGTVLVPGDQVEVQLSLRTKHAAEYVHLRDPRGAGFEPETTASQFKWDLGIGWYEEVRDSGTNFFFEWLPVGEYTFKYRLRANLAGTFRVGPATIQSMYAPEFTGYSSGAVLEIAPED